MKSDVTATEQRCEDFLKRHKRELESKYLWISVKDELPKFDTPVLITDGKISVVAQRSLAIAEDLKCKINDPFWLGFECNEFEQKFKNEEVTHWMKIPTLPVNIKECCATGSIEQCNICPRKNS